MIGRPATVPPTRTARSRNTGHKRTLLKQEPAVLKRNLVVLTRD